jgi:hypothetical protein
MLNIFMLSVVMLNAVAPYQLDHHYWLMSKYPNQA